MPHRELPSRRHGAAGAGARDAAGAQPPADRLALTGYGQDGPYRLRAGHDINYIGFALLLAEGIGDTIRVSLTAEPEEEIPVAYEILRSLELRSRGVTFVLIALELM